MSHPRAAEYSGCRGSRLLRSGSQVDVAWSVVVVPRSLLLGLVCASCVAARANAQDATVFYVHGMKGDSTPQLYYRPAGADTTRRISGVPIPLRVPENGRVCFQVDDANPVLYSYAVGSKALKTETADTVSSVLRGLLALIPKAAAATAGTPPGCLPGGAGGFDAQ